MKTQCNEQLMAQGKNCRVTYCAACKVYHLHVGPVSLRLESHMYADLSETLKHLMPEFQHSFVAH